MNKKVRIKYMNNVDRRQICDFDINIDDEDLLNQLISQTEYILKDKLLYDFDSERLYVVSNNELVEFSSEQVQTELTGKEEISICYSEIIALNNAARVDFLKLKSGSKIEFYVYPRELNHRYTPHTKARYNGSEMDISIEDNPQKLTGGFSGNNHSKYEKLSFEYVKNKKDFFLQKWYDFVESQF